MPSTTITFGLTLITECSISSAAQNEPLRTHSFNVNLSFHRRKLNSSIFDIGVAAGGAAEAMDHSLELCSTMTHTSRLLPCPLCDPSLGRANSRSPCST